jgi:hypothetical protein
MSGSQATRLLFADVTNPILQSFYATHSELGCGFLESVYKNAMTVLLREMGRVVDPRSRFRTLVSRGVNRPISRRLGRR